MIQNLSQTTVGSVCEYCSREVLIYLASSFYCFCINSGIGTGNSQGKHCACSMWIEQETRILSHFLQTSNIPPVFSFLLAGAAGVPFPVPGMEYDEVALKFVLVLLNVLCSPPEGRQTLKAIIVQHSSSLPRVKPGSSSVREASGSWCKVRSPYPPGYGFGEGLLASILELFQPSVQPDLPGLLLGGPSWS